MKVIWEPKDVSPGVRVGKPPISERWIIGYDPQVTKEHAYCMISLSDGMITQPGSKGVLATVLNDGGYLPEALLPDVGSR